jgi:hypothetical protein
MLTLHLGYSVLHLVLTVVARRFLGLNLVFDDFLLFRDHAFNHVFTAVELGFEAHFVLLQHPGRVTLISSLKWRQLLHGQIDFTWVYFRHQ